MGKKWDKRDRLINSRWQWQMAGMWKKMGGKNGEMGQQKPRM